MKSKNNLVVFAGHTGSGKTSISKPFALSQGLKWTSFGNVVRFEAARLGMSTEDKRVLQTIGQKMVENEPEHFCDLVFESLGADSNSIGVLDGLRHKLILDLLLDRVGDKYLKLAYVDVDNIIRHQRLFDSRGWLKEQCEEYDADVTEIELISFIRPNADVIIDNSGSLSESLAQVDIWALNFK